MTMRVIISERAHITLSATCDWDVDLQRSPVSSTQPSLTIDFIASNNINRYSKAAKQHQIDKQSSVGGTRNWSKRIQMIPSFNMTMLLLHDNTLIHCKANDSDPVFNRHGPTNNNIMLAFGLQHRLCCLLSLSATSHTIIINPNSFNRVAKRTNIKSSHFNILHYKNG